jgi:glucose-6-phosphate 1-epimerase
VSSSLVREEIGAGGMTRYLLQHESGARAEIYRYGAHVTSWKPAGEEDVFFLSENVAFQHGRPIRGGIPVIFPQFGSGPLPMHGLVRTREWSLKRQGPLPDGRPSVTLELRDDADTRAAWPFGFAAELTLTLGAELDVTMRIANQHATPFSFQTALHTYFAVTDIRRTQIVGFKGTTLTDSLRANAVSVDPRDVIEIGEEVDRIYSDVPGTLAIRDLARRRTVTISTRNMPDAVLWNPWIEKSKRLPDFGHEEFHRMVCVETGCIATPVVLAPARVWEGTTRFAVQKGI